MNAIVSRIAALAFIAVLAAGCTSPAPAPSSSSSAPPSSVAPSTSTGAIEDTGKIEGAVTDDGQAPIKGALVGIPSLNLTATTGQDGKFTFAQILPADYSVVASALGYESASASVTVTAGETLMHDFALKAIIVKKPFHLTYDYDGQITCGAAAVPYCGVVQDVQGSAGTPNPTNEYYNFNWTWEDGAFPDFQLIEIEWTPGSPATDKLSALYTTTSADDPTGIHTIKSVDDGTSPIVFSVTKADLIAAHNAFPESDFDLGMYPPLTGATVNQKFTIHRTDFFDGPIPGGFTAME